MLHSALFTVRFIALGALLALPPSVDATPAHPGGHRAPRVPVGGDSVRPGLDLTLHDVPTVPVSAPEAPAATAPPPPDPADRSPGWEQRMGAAALRHVGFDAATLGFRVEFQPGRPGLLGMTYPAERLITVWVRPGHGVADVAGVVAHELGHAVDVTWNTPARRQIYRSLRGLDDRSWFTCNGCTDFSTPAGDFAETFAWWVLEGTGRFRSELGPAPTSDQLRSLVPLFGP